MNSRFISLVCAAATAISLTATFMPKQARAQSDAKADTKADAKASTAAPPVAQKIPKTMTKFGEGSEGY
jgi:hypothetical protein